MRCDYYMMMICGIYFLNYIILYIFVDECIDWIYILNEWILHEKNIFNVIWYWYLLY